MSKLEDAFKKRAKRGQIESVILTSLALTGVGLVAIAAPNCVQLLKHVDSDWILKRDPKQRIREAAYRLKDKGLVHFERTGDRVRMRITDKGQQKLHTLVLAGPLPKAKRWDYKWRLAIFDIPEKKRGIRGRVRAIMEIFGFIRLQNSVWAYPYDCEEAITLLKSELKLGTELIYIIADAIEFDRPLREHFNLPLD